MLAYYILQTPKHLLMLTIDSLFVGLSPTYRVQPKPRWRSAAAQYTLSSGLRRGKVKIHLSLFTRVEEQHSCCLRAIIVFPLFLPLQMVLLRLSPMLSTCHTAWCLLWRLRTPFCYMTHSRLFPLAWWPTFTITHWVTLHGNAAPSCINLEVSCLFVVCGN